MPIFKIHTPLALKNWGNPKKSWLLEGGLWAFSSQFFFYCVLLILNKAICVWLYFVWYRNTVIASEIALENSQDIMVSHSYKNWKFVIPLSYVKCCILQSTPHLLAIILRYSRWIMKHSYMSGCHLIQRNTYKPPAYFVRRKIIVQYQCQETSTENPIH